MYRRDKSQQGTLAVFLARCLTWTRQRTIREGPTAKRLMAASTLDLSKELEGMRASGNTRSTLLFRKTGSEAPNLPKLSPSMDTEEMGFSAENPVNEESKPSQIIDATTRQGL